MAVNRGVETFLSVFLLCCWQGTELQPIKTSLGPITEGSLNTTAKNIPEVLDEILAQDILEPKTSVASETSPRTRSPIRTTLQTKEISRGMVENLHDHSFQTKHELSLSPEEKESSNGDVYRKLSVLDRLLEDIGQSEGSLDLTESIF
ncbi:sperm acrosome-associated protein 7 [Mastomys coucha]|uniref:sperm acrosome-associated protein 7 n=1 Tax=Mastomys coucha TaxID=35658 RepID=UPI00126152C9|nr:sperm acrosome-associated protein 7 [Mastomys coucha]